MYMNGLPGVIRKGNASLPISGWQIDFAGRRVYTQSAKMDIRSICDFPMTGDLVEVRCDGLHYIFYGQALVKKVLQSPSTSRKRKDDLGLDTALMLEFQDGGCGPYRVCECMALARNGHAMFFDLLRVTEIERLTASGDVRFICR